MFFVFDGGTGVGHLRRMACIARRLQGRFSCLIVTGHRAAAHWFVPEECEYIHLPAWDSLLESRSKYWGRIPFISLTQAEAVRFRKDMLKGIVHAFRPDLIFVDHLPLGSHGELEEIIENTNCPRYLVTRGVLNVSTNLGQLVLGGRACESLRSHYRRILVASDQKVIDFSKKYNISPELREKTVHTGYIVDPVPQDVIQRTRKARGIRNDDFWVVVSAGGGQLGEPLIESCLKLADIYRDIQFDIVVGPRSSIPWNDEGQVVVDRGNLHLHKETFQMSYLNASADLVICSGGYNSLLEALQGRGKILCFPNWKDPRDEQYHHAACLKNFVDIEVSAHIAELPALFERAVSLGGRQPIQDRRSELNVNGSAAIERIVLEDLEQDFSAEPLSVQLQKGRPND